MHAGTGGDRTGSGRSSSAESSLRRCAPCRALPRSGDYEGSASGGDGANPAEFVEDPGDGGPVPEVSWVAPASSVVASGADAVFTEFLSHVVSCPARQQRRASVRAGPWRSTQWAGSTAVPAMVCTTAAGRPGLTTASSGRQCRGTTARDRRCGQRPALVAVGCRRCRTGTPRPRRGHRPVRPEAGPLSGPGRPGHTAGVRRKSAGEGRWLRHRRCLLPPRRRDVGRSAGGVDLKGGADR